MYLKRLTGLIAVVSLFTIASGCNGTKPQESVEVSKSLGTRQCEQGDGTALDRLAETLTQAGVEVLSKKQDHDGKSYITVCGAPNGEIGIFSIPASQLDKAESVGFVRS